MTKSNLKDLSLFNNDGGIFMGAQRGIDQSRVSLLGVPYDGTCCFRPGARFGPSAIREDSYGIETYCPQLDLDLEDINFTDIGSLDVPLGDAELTLDYISDATNILLKNNLKRYSKVKKGKKFIIESSSKYTKNSQAKNKSGQTTYYQLIVEVNFEIISENKKNNLDIEERFIIKNYSNEYDENNYEKSVQKNMTNLVVENLILQLSRM